MAGAAPPDHSITQYPSSRARNPSRSPNRSTSSYAGRVASTSARSVSPGALAERLRPERQDREWAGVAAGPGRASGTARRRRLWRIVLNEPQRALIAARLATLARGQHQTAPLAVWHPACGGVGMNAKTLADFRVDHGAVLECLLVDSFTALVRAGVASLDRVAQDGVRVRASAGAASFRRHSTLQECRCEAEKAVHDLRTQLDTDPGAASRKQAAARRRAAEDRERRVRAALAVTEELHAKQQEAARKEAERAARKAPQDAAADAKGEAGEPASKKPREKEPRASTTDAQARVMKMADGGFRPAYNVQFATDTKSTAIAGVSVDNIGSDMGKMLPMNDALAGQYGTRPRQHLADGGFAKLDDIEALAQNGVETFVPVPKPRNVDRDRHAPQPSDPPGVADWRNRMGGDDAKRIYKERAATAECANAQARNRGLTQFLVRSMDKVKTIALWHALTHNMVCTWRLI